MKFSNSLRPEPLPRPRPHIPRTLLPLPAWAGLRPELSRPVRPARSNSLSCSQDVVIAPLRQCTAPESALNRASTGNSARINSFQLAVNPVEPATLFAAHAGTARYRRLHGRAPSTHRRAPATAAPH